MRVLVGCELSGVVRRAFRARGHEAWSCDLEPAEDGGPHIQTDVLYTLDQGWDLAIFHPPCTYLCVSGLHWNMRPEGIAIDRAGRTEAALDLVRVLLAAPVGKIALENPAGCISTRIRKPDQIVQPYDFGDDASKATHLWLKGLPPLKGTAFMPPRYVCKCGGVFGYGLGKYGCSNCNGDSGAARPRWGNQTDSGQNRLGPSPTRQRERSRTYEGIAAAMAEQWG